MDIILFILVLGINILIHEYAHFYFARKADILCYEFSIGMGPALYQKKKGETLYAVRAIPLGGYVSMAGEDLVNYIEKGQNIGINLDELGIVNEMVVNNETSYDHVGTVIDYDLYGANGKELFLTMNISGEEKTFVVSREAEFVLSAKKSVQVGPAERSYETKTKWQRFKVVFAGPASNFLLAFFILFFVALFVGKPVNTPVVGDVSDHVSVLSEDDLINTINGEPVNSYDDISRLVYSSQNNYVNVTVNNDNVSFKVPLTLVFQGLGFGNTYNDDTLTVGLVGGSSQLKLEDQIQAIHLSDEDSLINTGINYTNVNTWSELISYVEDHKELSHVYLQVLRDGEIQEVNYSNLKASTLERLDSRHIIYQIGIGQQTEFNLLYPLYYPFAQIGNDMKSMVNTLGLLFGRGTGVGVKDLAGPIGIFSLVSNARSGGAASFFIFVAFLSVNIGFLNLLPIPALDGGRLVFIAYEAITKKKVNKKVENTLILITFVLLLTLMVVVTYQDILRLFR